MKYFIKTGVGFSQKISNSCIVLCGDVGLGFSPNLENMKISFLNKLCEKTNNYIIAIRGNHDNPEFFKGIYNKRFKAVEDYSVVQFKDKNILCIGGGTSVDRIYRKDNKWRYWEDEKIIELYWVRDQRAITCSQQKYGAYCHKIAQNVLHNESDCEECMNETATGKIIRKSVEREKFLTYMKRCRTVFPVKIWSYMWKIWNLRR